PELGEVPRGVRVLRPERRPERVDLAERAGERLDLELPADGQEGWLVEEVLGVVHNSPLAPLGRGVGGEGGLLRVDGGDAEERAGPLAVAGGDDGRVDVEEAV